MYHHMSSSNSSRAWGDSSIWYSTFLSCGRPWKTFKRRSRNTSVSSKMLEFPSQTQGIALVIAFTVESGLILGGNVLAIIIFLQEKKLRKKSLFLVMNMALADVMLGAVALPLYVYLIVGPDYQLWTAKAAHKSIFYFLDTTFSQSSLISAGSISWERFNSVFWPLKHKTLSMRTYGIVIFTVWSLAILVSIIAVLFYEYNSFKVATLSWMSFPLCFLFIVCACNFSIWRKVRTRNITLHQQNRAAFQNQRLTNALLFVSAISVLSWLPLVIVNYLVFVQGVDIPRRFLFVDIINILNLSNSILNPFVYALRIPEFRQALRVSCCSRRQDVMNRPGIVGRENMAAVLTPVLQQRAIQCFSSQVQQMYGKEIMDTKLWTKILSNAILTNSNYTTGEKNERHYNGLKDVFLLENYQVLEKTYFFLRWLLFSNRFWI